MSLLQMLAGMMGAGDKDDLGKSLQDAAVEWREFRQDVKAIRASLERIEARLPPTPTGAVEPAAAAAIGDVTG